MCEFEHFFENILWRPLLCILVFFFKVLSPHPHVHEWKDLSTYRGTGFYEWRNSGLFDLCSWGKWHGRWALFFYRFRVKLQKLHHQDGIGNGKFICKRWASFREGLGSQSLDSWVCQAAASLSMSHSKPSPLFCYNIKTIARQWKNTRPPSCPNNIMTTERRAQRHAYTHTRSLSHAFAQSNFLFSSAQNEAAANLLKQTNVGSLSLLKGRSYLDSLLTKECQSLSTLFLYCRNCHLQN